MHTFQVGQTYQTRSIGELTPLDRLVYLVSDGIEYVNAHYHVCEQLGLSFEDGAALTAEYERAQVQPSC